MNQNELEQQFVNLMDNHKQMIYKVCLMYANDDEGISDLFQEVALNLWKSFPHFRGDCKPSTWVYRVSVNT